MSYTISDLRAEFPDDDACLDHIFREKYPEASGYYRIKNRKSYVNKAGHQIHPLKGTIFEKSSTPLTLWFHAIWLFSVSKNGVSAKEIQRQVGVTYKTAWRMANRIRSLMAEDVTALSGTVEMDEAYVGGRRRNGQGGSGKATVFGMVERGGRVRTRHVPGRHGQYLLPEIVNNVPKGTNVVTDEYQLYRKLPRMGYPRKFVKHGKKHWRHGIGVHTNTIEGYWGRLKPSLKGTYRTVSRKHLQGYLDEFSFRHNRRGDPAVFRSILERVV